MNRSEFESNKSVILWELIRETGLIENGVSLDTINPYGAREDDVKNNKILCQALFSSDIEALREEHSLKCSVESVKNIAAQYFLKVRLSVWQSEFGEITDRNKIEKIILRGVNSSAILDLTDEEIQEILIKYNLIKLIEEGIVNLNHKEIDFSNNSECMNRMGEILELNKEIEEIKDLIRKKQDDLEEAKDKASRLFSNQKTENIEELKRQKTEENESFSDFLSSIGKEKS